MFWTFVTRQRCWRAVSKAVCQFVSVWSLVALQPTHYTRSTHLATCRAQATAPQPALTPAPPRPKHGFPSALVLVLLVSRPRPVAAFIHNFENHCRPQDKIQCTSIISFAYLVDILKIDSNQKSFLDLTNHYIHFQDITPEGS